VGLATAACFANGGFSVHGVDSDLKKISMIEKGRSPIRERGLDSLVRKAIKRKSLVVSSSYDGLGRSSVVFITVGTPSKEDGGMNPEFLESASKEVGRHMSTARGYRLVVVKSTVAPGTTEGVIRPIIERASGRKVGRDIGLASNPEFLHEGSAIYETLHPEAIVIGGHDKKSSNTLVRLYDTFYKKHPMTIVTSPSNAEMMKYAINGGRAVQLSFVNTVADLCTRIPGCDYDEVRKGLSVVAKMDQRYLAAGMGFGGSCLPKDTRALAAALRSTGVGDELMASALNVNEGQVEEAIRVAERLCGSMDGRRVAVLGLAFKAGTDDIRESSAIALIRALIRMGAEISAYDPSAMANARELFGSQVTFSKTARDCIRNSECAFVATGWPDFLKLRPKDFKALMSSPVVVDGRRLFNQTPFEKAGVTIVTIGTYAPLGEAAGQLAEERRKESRSEKKQVWHYTFKGVVAQAGGPQT
jgi:UDPglucose 6-dehydrogenase